jgi:hypothetical protein
MRIVLSNRGEQLFTVFLFVMLLAVPFLPALLAVLQYFRG